VLATMNHKINSLGIPRESNSTHLGINHQVTPPDWKSL
jgi:hypothetical protein